MQEKLNTISQRSRKSASLSPLFPSPPLLLSAQMLNACNQAILGLGVAL